MLMKIPLNNIFIFLFIFQISLSFSYDIEKTKSEFPVLQQKMNNKQLIYFDSAATTQKPKQVLDTLNYFYLNDYATVHRCIYDLSLKATQQYDQSRKKIQKFINAKYPEEIVFTKGTTDGLNIIVASLGKEYLKENDEVIISEMEHHSNIVPWQMLQKEKNIKIKVIPINDKAELILDEYEKLLTNNTKIVSIAHVANSTGTINPIETIIKKAHEKNALVIIDGAQAIAHIPIDVRKLDADFYVFSAHKIYGPTGIGALYGKIKLLEKMPPIQGGGDMIKTVSFEETTYQKPPVKFEAGTPAFAEAIAFGKAIDYVNEIGIKNIQKHENDLLSYATKKIMNVPNLQIIGTADNKAAIISFLVEDISPTQLAYQLNKKGIAIRSGCHCAQPTMQHFKILGTNRISFGLYNTKDEIDTFIFALKDSIYEIQAKTGMQEAETESKPYRTINY